MSPTRTLVVCLIAASGCQGTIGDTSGPWTPPPSRFEQGVVDFECGDGSSRIDEPLRRLSRTQLQNSVRDVLTTLLGAEASTVLNESRSALDSIPNDLRAEHEVQQGQQLFSRSDQAVGGSAVEAHFRIATSLGEALATPSRLNAMGFECLTDGDTSNDAGCLDRFVRELGLLTHRRPIGDDEFSFLRTEAYGSGDTVDLDALADLLTVLFAQPSFIFHVEGTGELTAYEAASRLSYHFWDSMPDSALFEAAESGRLLTEEGWNESVSRVLEDDRSRGAIASFLDEWFRFDQLNPASSGQGADFDAITAGLNLDASFDAAAQGELVDLFLYVLRNGGTFEDFFLSEVTPTSHPELAAIYGVEPAEDGAVVVLPPERHGILTRVGLLLSRAVIALPTVNSITHPILRGVFVRRQIVCDELPEAPGGAMDNLPSVDRSVTGSREATSILTGSLGCSGCHSRINSAGYALERFDPIGQYRSEEPLFDADGTETMRLPIDDEVTVIEAEDPISGGAALGDALYESEKAGACFARHYTRFALGRSEDIERDGCLLRSVDEAIDEDRPLQEVLSLVVLDPNFRVRAEN